ncbi:hypothetical protein HOO54_21355 [Bacillus sp. WMMC1349]|uniref:hypothetical protein n=1 Tax=Bacillus sp. WMMC1349 TaxID=2736254 RepID=UPI001556D32A|nr:hypothetical protein [Bacillus sp. WMMC1349]NPC94701.1 hypothetical protein [Bacillus sp. WMMC1349]
MFRKIMWQWNRKRTVQWIGSDVLFIFSDSSILHEKEYQYFASRLGIIAIYDKFCSTYNDQQE